MSRFAIRHRTSYRYTVPVSLAPHLLRLTPRADSARLVSRQLWVSPTPLSVAEESDAFGNARTRLDFGPELTPVLQVESLVVVETSPPPDLTLAPPLPTLPWLSPLADALSPFREEEPDGDVSSLAHALSNEVGAAPLPFFDRLCRYLHDNIERGLRLEGAAQTPARTLALRSGACRDLTVLFLAVCRSLGVAGRFVSGYQGQEETPDGQRHLHAWPEVWVPGLGWLGWDPMHGVRAGPGHVALSVAPAQSSTMPIEGGFYFSGESVTSTLDYSITFEQA